MGPLVSILIAAYNHDRFVLKCLNSIKNEVYENIEICIIDDGSSDSTAKVIEKWIMDNPRYTVTFRKQKNRGICTTANRLIDMSKGQYLLWLASDDYLINNTINQRVELLELNKHKDVVVSDALVVDENDSIISNSTIEQYNRGKKKRFYHDSTILIDTIKNPSISGSTYMVRRKLYNKIGYFNRLLKAEDWFFFQRAASLNKIMFYDKVVSCYRVHSKNTSGMHVSLIKKRKMSNSIILTFLVNFMYFPFGFKSYAIREICRWILISLNLTRGIYFENHKKA